MRKIADFFAQIGDKVPECLAREFVEEKKRRLGDVRDGNRVRGIVRASREMSDDVTEIFFLPAHEIIAVACGEGVHVFVVDGIESVDIDGRHASSF